MRGSMMQDLFEVGPLALPTAAVNPPLLIRKGFLAKAKQLVIPAYMLKWWRTACNAV